MLPVGTKSGCSESVDGSVVAEQIDIKASTDALQELNRSSDMWPCTLSSEVLHRLSKTNAPVKSCGGRSNRCAATRDSRIPARTSLTVLLMLQLHNKATASIHELRLLSPA